MSSPLATLAFGLLLGFTHAFEADHILAVATMISDHKSSFRVALIGTYWGFGHTTTLFVVGLLVMLLKVSIPQRMSLTFELAVAAMLVFLGLRTLLRKDKPPHDHAHEHGNTVHTHIHVKHLHSHNKRSFAVGIIHGLAGSGALMVLVLATIGSFIEGIVYILLFGIGSIVGMTLTSLVLGVPLALSLKKFTHVGKIFQIVAGLASICLGAWMVYELIFIQGVFNG